MVSGDALIFRNREINLVGVFYEPEGLSDLELGAEETKTLVLRAETNAGLVVRRIYTFFGDRYDIQHEVEVEIPETLQAELGDLLRVRLAWVEGIASTEKNKKMEEPNFRSFAKVGEEIHFKKRQKIGQPEKVRESFQGTVRFAGLHNQYFFITGIVQDDPTQPVTGNILLDGDQQRNQLSWAMELPLSSSAGAGGIRGSAKYTLYIGPSDIDILKQYGHGLEQTIDLGPMGIFHPVARLILSLMVWLYRWIPNYGLVIIIISLATKIAFYPLTRTSTQSMKKMQELQPQIKALQEKYKDDREKLGKATMQLYKDKKVNPMSGCLPLLVQSPVFIALFQALRNSIALRHAPFALWINDLSQPDALFLWPMDLPFLGNNFNVLPVLMSMSMWLQTKLTPTTASGGQMAIMNTMLPIMMLVFFYNMPSGLVLYWLVNTVMTIYQTWRIQRAAPTTGGAQAT
jgi:YidC/Oxa1 family membrane protein insertase